jgi:hypothetical protein
MQWSLLGRSTVCVRPIELQSSFSETASASIVRVDVMSDTRLALGARCPSLFGRGQRHGTQRACHVSPITSTLTMESERVVGTLDCNSILTPLKHGRLLQHPGRQSSSRTDYFSRCFPYRLSKCGQKGLCQVSD